MYYLQLAFIFFGWTLHLGTVHFICLHSLHRTCCIWGTHMVRRDQHPTRPLLFNSPCSVPLIWGTSPCFRPALSDGPLPWRDVLHLWNWGHLICPARWGGPSWPLHLRLPSDDKVHLPQVWDIRKHWKPWRTLHPPAQHLQRENLHLHVVLFSPADRPHRAGSVVPVHYNHISKDEGLSLIHPLPPNQEGVH